MAVIYNCNGKNAKKVKYLTQDIGNINNIPYLLYSYKLFNNICSAGLTNLPYRFKMPPITNHYVPIITKINYINNNTVKMI